MSDLFSLFQSLTTAEWQSFQAYLTCFTTHEQGELKYLQLARFLRESGNCPSAQRSATAVYGKYNATAFDKLKLRLQEKALDFLLTDISNDKKNELDEADLAIIKIKKKSAQFQQLYYSKKRLPDLLYGLLDEIIFLAKEYEQYSMLVDHLRHKKNMVSWKKGRKEFETISREMNFYSKCSRLYNKAEHYYYQLGMLNVYDGKPDEARKFKFLKKAIPEIAEENKIYKSPHVRYSLKILELEYYQLLNNYAKARSVCLEWLKIVRNNKSVFRRQRLGIVYDNLSRCELYLALSKHISDPEEAGEFYVFALKSARDAQKYFNAGSENLCIALEQEFYALFAMEQFAQAEETARKMLNSATRKELGEFRFAKYNVLLANALFKLRRFTEAQNILSQELEISKDKAGWETGARILNIMSLIEMLKLDEAGMAVLSLRQFYKRTEKKSRVSPRDKKILNLLQVAERAGFMFSTLNGNTDKYMSPLCSEDKDLRWEPFTHEVIPFHEWFAGKMKISISKFRQASKPAKVKVEVLK
jgi:tetratricopeptide (TPR) repeat protein